MVRLILDLTYFDCLLHECNADIGFEIRRAVISQINCSINAVKLFNRVSADVLTAGAI